MASQNYMSLESFRNLIETLIERLAKSKALSSVASSCELIEYQHEIVSNYLNAILQFHEEMETVALELQNQFYKLVKYDVQISTTLS